ncbi:hypothetical protein [Chitinilyticum litopenaei]|uniref:hypothetical protein n=1 Tax=Chitinilyticum litopenaei TaxID=1121276 RepID=UPI000401E3E0|nr:hypothetical protein [Chitinilyticum litopenaei]
MRYAIHPVWVTTHHPQQIRYGLYVVGPQGERELASSASLDMIEDAREALLQAAGNDNKDNPDCGGGGI